MVLGLGDRSLSEFVVEIITKGKEAEEARDRKEACILTVPIAIVGEFTDFYYPAMVSIGPYYNFSDKKEDSLTQAEKERGKQLAGMESDKLLATRRFWQLFDGERHKAKLQAIVEVCEQKKVTNKYDRDLSYLPTKKLAQMCFVDVAFLLEFLNTFVMGFNRQEEISSSSTNATAYKGWDDSSAQGRSTDPIFYERSNNPVLFTILTDVMKLENQLPMVILEKTMEIMQKKNLLEDLLRHLCCHISPMKSQYPWPCRSNLKLVGCKHLLDCLRLTLVANQSWVSYKKQFELENSNSAPISPGCDIRSPVLKCLYFLFSPLRRKREVTQLRDQRYLPFGAVKLKKAGVVFKAMEHGGIHDISFEKQTGTLLLPVIDVGVWTEAVLRNLLAFEACDKSGSTEVLERSNENDEKIVTRFILFMSQLVETEDDAGLFRELHIIQNNLGDNKEVAKLWNDINTSRWIPKCNHFDKLTMELNEHIAQRWMGWFAELWEKYLSKAWLILAIVIAIAVLAETFVSLWSSLRDNA